MVDFRKRTDDILKMSTRVFGEEVTFYPSSGGVYNIKGIFDNAYQAVDPETQEVISSNQATIGVNLNDIPNNEILKGDQFKVRDSLYRTIDSQEDGQGGTTVLIQKIREDEKINIRKYPRSFDR